MSYNQVLSLYRRVLKSFQIIGISRFVWYCTLDPEVSRTDIFGQATSNVFIVDIYFSCRRQYKRLCCYVIHLIHKTVNYFLIFLYQNRYIFTTIILGLYSKRGMIFIKVYKFLLLVSFFAVLTVIYGSNVLAQGTLPAKGYLDSPTNGSNISGQTDVHGWFLDGSGVSKVQVLVDGKTVGTAKYGIIRTDVAKAFPTYKNTTSGYQYTLDTTILANGKHSLAIKETGKNGVSTSLRIITVNVQNLPAKGSIDSPTNGTTISGQSVVKGWFLDGSGVSKVEVLIDGKTIGTAQYGIARSDVAKVYPQYKNTNSGYQYTLDTTKFTNGKHTLVVKETGRNGAVKTLAYNITVTTETVASLAAKIRSATGATVLEASSSLMVTTSNLAVANYALGNNYVILGNGASSNAYMAAVVLNIIHGTSVSALESAILNFYESEGASPTHAGNITINRDPTGRNVIASW